MTRGTVAILLNFTVFVAIGLLTGIGGIKGTQWEYWALIILVSLYGLAMALIVRREKNDCPECNSNKDVTHIKGANYIYESGIKKTRNEYMCKNCGGIFVIEEMVDEDGLQYSKIEYNRNWESIDTKEDETTDES